MSRNDGGLPKALVASIKSGRAVDLAQDYAEIGVDAVLEGGLLEEIPFVKTLVAISKLPSSVSDRLLIKKLIKFLGPLHHIGEADRVDLINRLENDPKYSRIVGEHFLELLSRIDSHSKPEMVAKVLLGYASGKIDAAMLHRLNAAIESLPFYEIPNVRTYFDAEPKERLEIPANTLQAIMMAGLATAASGWGSLVFEPTDVCEKFLELGLDSASV